MERYKLSVGVRLVRRPHSFLVCAALQCAVQRSLHRASVFFFLLICEVCLYLHMKLMYTLYWLSIALSLSSENLFRFKLVCHLYQWKCLYLLQEITWLNKSLAQSKKCSFLVTTFPYTLWSQSLGIPSALVYNYNFFCWLSRNVIGLLDMHMMNSDTVSIEKQ